MRSSANELMAHIDPGKAQAVCHNVFWVKRSVGDIYLNDLEQNPQHEQNKKGDKPYKKNDFRIHFF